MTGQCCRCWDWATVEWIMAPLAMGDPLTPGVLAVAGWHQRRAASRSPELCDGVGLPLERVA